MYSPTDYCLNLTPNSTIQDAAEEVFDLVWRTDFSAPGFAVLEIMPGLGSQTMRSWIVSMKERLSEINIRRGGQPFSFRSLARFDQQVTTKFHLDGAPEESMLILGYEPTKVVSRLFLADYTRAAFDLGNTLSQFLQDFNPMFKKGEEILGRFVTELPQPSDGHSRLLFINNSSLPFTAARTNPLGVMHKAIIVTPDEAERRIVNSTMLATESGGEISAEQQEEFVTTEKISQKNY